MQLPVAGIDFLGGELIEVNKCPSLILHDIPMSGKNRHTVQHYLDYLETLIPS